MLIRTVVTSFIAIILFVILIMRSSMTTRTVYKFGFFLGFAVLLVSLLPRPGEPQMTWVEVEIGRGRLAYVFAWLLALVPPLLPFVVVIEAGLSGYRGFSSSFRYVALAMAAFGVAGLVASFLIPKLIQR
jgi:hypothetical protein